MLLPLTLNLIHSFLNFRRCLMTIMTFDSSICLVFLYFTKHWATRNRCFIIFLKSNSLDSKRLFKIRFRYRIFRLQQQKKNSTFKTLSHFRIFLHIFKRFRFSIRNFNHLSQTFSIFNLKRLLAFVSSFSICFLFSINLSFASAFSINAFV